MGKRLGVAVLAAAVLLACASTTHAITVAPAFVTATSTTRVQVPLSSSLSLGCNMTMALHVLNPIALPIPALPFNGYVDGIALDCAPNDFVVEPLEQILLNGASGWPTRLTQLLGGLPPSGVAFTMNVAFQTYLFGDPACLWRGTVTYLLAQNSNRKAITASNLTSPDCPGTVNFFGRGAFFLLSSNITLS